MNQHQVDLQYYVQMFKLYQQTERLRDITMLKIKILDYQQHFVEMNNFKLLDLLNDQCENYQERIKKDLINKNTNFSSLILESQSDQEEEDLIMEQNFNQIKQKYYSKIEDRESCEGSCQLLLNILEDRINQKIETIIFMRFDFLNLFKNHDYGLEIIWKFPQANYNELEIEQYILYVMQKKVNYFQHMFDISKQNINLNEVFFLIITFMQFKNYYESYQKIIIYENIIDYFTKPKFTIDDSTISWAYGINCIENQKNNLLKLKQLFQDIEMHIQMALQDQQKDYYLSQEQISPIYAQFLRIINMNSLKISNLFEQLVDIEDAQLMVDKLGFMKEQQFFENQLLIVSKIINSSIFQKAVGNFYKYMAIYDPQQPNLEMIRIYFIYQKDFTTAGQTCFEGSIFINLYQVLKKYKEENLIDFQQLIKGWIMNIFTHEYFHYILRYYIGSYNCYTPELLERKRNKEDINWYKKVQKIMEFPSEAGYIGQQFLYHQSKDKKLVVLFNIQMTKLMLDYDNWENQEKFETLFKHSQNKKLKKNSIKMFEQNEMN